MNTVRIPRLDGLNDDRATADRVTKAIHIIADALDAMGVSGSATRAQSVSPRLLPLAFGWFAAIVRNG